MFNKIKNFFKKKKAERRIGNYEIVGDKLRVKTGLFSYKEIDNTEKNIELLNDELQRQHNEYNYKEENKKAWDYGKDATTFACIGLAFGIFNIVTAWIPALIVTNLCLLGTLYTGARYYHKLSKLDNHDKIEYLNEGNNKEVLNEEINDATPEAEIDEKIKGVDLKTTSAIYREKSIVDGKDIFDINSINGMTLKGLKKIRENLEMLRNPEEIETVESEIVDGPTLRHTNN